MRLGMAYITSGVLAFIIMTADTVRGTVNPEWCSRQCTCLNNYRTVDCARRDLTRVPALSNLTVNLYMDTNFIKELSTDTFSTLTNLMVLHLQSNQISAVTADHFTNLQNLQVLNLANNKLETFEIAENISLEYRLSALKELNLNNNRLTTVPKNLAQFMPSLKSLNISFNWISSIALNGSLSNLLSLRVLDLRGNRIVEIMANDLDWLGSIPLSTLSLSECGLVHVDPSAFSQLTEVASLSLSRNLIGHGTLEAIFNAIGNNSQLVQLDLSEMYLPNITVRLLGMLPRLGTLDLFESSIRVIEPALFDCLPEIEYLNLGRNELHELNNVGALKQLRRLNAEGNHLKNVDLTDLRSLESVDLSGNDIEVLPPGWLGHKDNLQVLNMSYNQITSIHPETFLDLSLQTLDLSYNQLTILDGLGLKGLRKINLSNNRLATIAPQMFDNIAKTLEDVDMSHNNISQCRGDVFPEFISLQELNLAYNQLGSTLGSGSMASLFSSMGHLQLLDLSGNAIKTIGPGQWKFLHHVNTVCLAYNHITTLADVSLNELSALARLDLGYNDLSVIDASVLGSFDYLEEIDFSNNPLACTECTATPFLRWLNRSSAVRVLNQNNKISYQCYSPPELEGQYFLAYQPVNEEGDCRSVSNQESVTNNELNWAMIGIAIAGVAVFLSLAAVLFFHSQICQKIKSLHYHWQVRYREVSGVEFTNDPKV